MESPVFGNPAAATAESISHIPQFGGVVWYVDATTGSDTSGGLGPGEALATIGEAISRASNGDAISIKAGVYTETGLDMSLDYLELWPEIGTEIDPATGTALTISGDYCRVCRAGDDLRVSPAADVLAILTTGTGPRIENVLMVGSASLGGIDSTASAQAFIRGCRATGIKAGGVAFDTDAATVLIDCNTVGDTTSTGFRGTGLAGLMRNCTSTGHQTAGFDLDSGTDSWTVQDCVSASGDGTRIDLGTNNMWAGWVDQLESEHHEEVYPHIDGEGTAAALIAVDTDSDDETNAKSSTQWYWGEPFTLVPMSVLTDAWDWIGLNLYGDTANKAFYWHAYQVCTTTTSARNGGNAWDEGATVLTVVDGSLYQAGDLVWVASTYKTNGEVQRVISSIANVVTIAREAVAAGAADTGLRWDHTTNAAGTETLTLIFRSTDDALHGLGGDFSAASSKVFFTTKWHITKRMTANCGVIIRAVNRDDGTNGAGFDASLIYED